MKKTLKRALTALIAAALLLSCLPLSSSADDLWVDADVDALWERKLEEHPILHRDEEGEWLFYEPYVRESISLIPFLYTKAFQELDFEMRYFKDPEAEDFPYFMGVASNKGDIEAVCLPYVNRGLQGYGYMYSEKLNQVLLSCFDLSKGGDPLTEWHTPTARACIEAFGITKEELKEACALSRSNPDAIRKILSMFTDEEFERFKREGILESHLDESYVLDALYLSDGEQARALCYEHFMAVVNGRGINMGSVVYVQTTARLEWLKTQDLRTKSFRYFLENAEPIVENLQDEYQFDASIPKVFFTELKALAYADPPKAGDPTAAYALIFTLAALPLAGFGVYEWKRRRRVI